MTTTSATNNTPVTGTVADTSATKTNASQQELASNFSEFLTLLTTQLQNQDPLNPMDSNEFTQQLVQYSQVEQQLNTNSKLDNLTTLSMNSSLSLALGYVGKDITYTSSEMNFDGSTPVNISYNLASAAGTSTASIYDENGDLVDTINIDGSTGTHNFTWDGSLTDGGTAGEGTYSVKINALSASDNTAISVTTAVTGQVRGIESQDGVPYLLVGDRSVNLGNVINTSLHTTTTNTSV
jgi:flagellar basal-body rod modification protein FlgD